ncbi:MAG: class II aldolase/adducin family protein, partial [Maritimibacter sp.]
VLVAGHGPFTWGKDADEAVRNAVILEETAKMAALTVSISGHNPEPLEDYVLDYHYQRKHGKNAWYGQK